MVRDDEQVGLDGVRVVFDDDRVVSDAGIALIATLAGRLGIADRPARRDRPRSPHLPPTAASDARPADAHRAPVDTSPSCTLALAR
jgi:hypothetical protein